MSPPSFTHISVVVVSDDRLLSDALVQFLSEQPDLLVLACPPDPDPTRHDVTRACDIVLLDARSDTIVSTGRTLPERPVVIFVGASEDDQWATAALSAGARGILTRSATREEVAGAIRVVHGGGIWARRRWLNQCILHVVGASKRSLVTRDVVDTRLSRREREVLRHAATGVCNKEIADRLSITEATVKAHLGRIFQKLGVTGRAALAATYHDLGTTFPPGRTTSARQTIPSDN